MREDEPLELLPVGLHFSCPRDPDGNHLVSNGRYCLRCGGVTRKPPRASGRHRGWGVTAILIQRDGSSCWLCPEEFTRDNLPTVDHVVPVCEGGSNKLANLRLAHGLCNQMRANPRYGMGRRGSALTTESVG